MPLGCCRISPVPTDWARGFGTSDACVCWEVIGGTAPRRGGGGPGRRRRPRSGQRSRETPRRGSRPLPALAAAAKQKQPAHDVTKRSRSPPTPVLTIVFSRPGLAWPMYRERTMGDEIQLISDGDGLAVIGDPAAVDRFLAAEGLPSKD